MDKCEQIKKLADASTLIYAVVLQHTGRDFADKLNAMVDEIADIADQIEGIEIV